MGPLDPKKKVPLVGVEIEAKTLHNKTHFDQTVFQKKDRTGFGGGFKIPEEYREKKENYKKKKVDKDKDNDMDKEKDLSLITRDEVIAHLNLGNAESGIGGKGGANSKLALTKDIIEGLEKDLDKLKKLEGNIQRRKQINLNGGIPIIEETDEQKEENRKAMIRAQVESEGAFVIEANELRMQLFRHKPGQLDSYKNLDYKELEKQREAQKVKLLELQQRYYANTHPDDMPKYVKLQMKEHLNKMLEQHQHDEADEINARLDGTSSRYKKTVSVQTLQPGKKKKLQDGWIVDGEDEIATMWRTDQSAGKKKKSVGFHSIVKSDMSNRKSIDHSFSSRHNRSTNSVEHHSNSQPKKGVDKKKSVGFHSNVKSDVSYRKSSDNSFSPRHNHSTNSVEHNSNSQPKNGMGALAASLKSMISNKSAETSPSRHHHGGSSHGGSRHSHSNSRGGKKVSPRRGAFEAKFDKFLANKSQKILKEARKEAQKQQDFDIVTKDSRSPSKRSKLFKDKRDVRPQTFKKGKEEISLLPEEREYQTFLMKQNQTSSPNLKIRQASGDSSKQLTIPLDEKQKMKEVKLPLRTASTTDTNQIKKQNGEREPFKFEGVSKEDKMTFFLLKWIFNAIKLESDKEDKVLKGQPYVTKKELISQLQQNEELMHVMNFPSVKKMEKQVQRAHCVKFGLLTWPEFLEFFFVKDGDFHNINRDQEWWSQIDTDGKKIEPHMETPRALTQSEKDLEEGLSSTERKLKKERLLEEQKEIPITPALEMLIKSRQVKTEQEVDEEYKKNQKLLELQDPQPKKTKQKVISDDLLDEDNFENVFGDQRVKSECLLLDSHIKMMKEVFERSDKYNDQILRRSDFLMYLRTDELVVDFIDVDAVKVANTSNKPKILTLDQVFMEIEKDETYEMKEMGKQTEAVNHKEFITWREFINYFKDYREIQDRNKKASRSDNSQSMINQVRQAAKKEVDPEEELKSLLQKEKERRLKELPKLRPADQIDITEEQLQVIKNVFDKEKIQDVCDSTTFFFAIRKNPRIKAMSSALARDPEGTSRLQKETFQQVFDRMERDLNKKKFEWSVVVEYFTKRGKPLTKEEIKKLQDEDKRLKQEEEDERKRIEDQEKRKQARLLADLEQEEDFEAYQLRMKMEEGNAGQNSGKTKDTFANSESSDNSDKSDRSDKSSEDSKSGDDEGKEHKRRVKSVGVRTDPTKEFGNDIYGPEVQGGKKGRYGVTVPQPFAFDIRDKVRPKSIRERKVEMMIEGKKQEEEEALKQTFRCKPIPPKVLQPQYESIMTANEKRREKVKQECVEITKSREAPFSFWTRDKEKLMQRVDSEAALNAECKRPHFKANPIPKACSVLIYDKKVEEEEQKRQKRIHEKAELSYALSQMPRRMQKDQDRKAQMPQKDLHEQYSFRPKIGENVTAEMFKTMQRKFEEKLLRKKSQMAKTIPKSPNFRQSKSKPLQRDYVNETAPTFKPAKPITIKHNDETHRLIGGNTLSQSQSVSRLYEGKPVMRSSSKNDEEIPVKQPQSTRAMELSQKARRDQIEATRTKELQQMKEDMARKKRQDRIKAEVQGAIAARLPPKPNKTQEDSPNKLENNEEQRRKEDLKKGIEKARSRPLLLESSYNKTEEDKNVAKTAAAKVFYEVLKQSGLKQAEIERMMTADEVDLLRIDREKEKLKKFFVKM